MIVLGGDYEGYWYLRMATYDVKESPLNDNSNEKIARDTEYQENKLPARLLRVNEVARFLGVHSSTVRRWEKRGLLKSYPIGPRRSLRFKQEDVLDFLHQYRREMPGEPSATGSTEREPRRTRPKRG